MTAEMMLRKIYEYKVDIIEKQEEIYQLEDKIVELSKDAYDIIPNGEKHLFNLTENKTAIVEITTDTVHMLPNETDLNIINKDREFWKNAVRITLANFINKKA